MTETGHAHLACFRPVARNVFAGLEEIGYILDGCMRSACADVGQRLFSRSRSKVGSTVSQVMIRLLTAHIVMNMARKMPSYSHSSCQLRQVCSYLEHRSN